MPVITTVQKIRKNGSRMLAAQAFADVVDADELLPETVSNHPPLKLIPGCARTSGMIDAL